MKDALSRYAEARVVISGTPVPPIIMPPQFEFSGIEDTLLPITGGLQFLPHFTVDILSSHVNMVEATLRAMGGMLIPVPDPLWLIDVKVHEDGTCTGVLPGQDTSSGSLQPRTSSAVAPGINPSGVGSFGSSTPCLSLFFAGKADTITNGLKRIKFIGNQHYNGNFSLVLEVTKSTLR